MTRENLISYANDLEKQLEVEKNNKSGKSLTILGGRLLTYGFKFGCSVMLFLFFIFDKSICWSYIISSTRFSYRTMKIYVCVLSAESLLILALKELWKIIF